MTICPATGRKSWLWAPLPFIRTSGSHQVIRENGFTFLFRLANSAGSSNEEANIGIPTLQHPIEKQRRGKSERAFDKEKPEAQDTGAPEPLASLEVGGCRDEYIHVVGSFS